MYSEINTCLLVSVTGVIAILPLCEDHLRLQSVLCVEELSGRLGCKEKAKKFLPANQCKHCRVPVLECLYKNIELPHI